MKRAKCAMAVYNKLSDCPTNELFDCHTTVSIKQKFLEVQKHLLIHRAMYASMRIKLALQT